jgi:CheY-like chemotaxis protein
MVRLFGSRSELGPVPGLEAQGQSSPADLLSLEGCKVLVVEDEAVQALDLQCSLQALGCEVLGPASSAAGAIELLDRARSNLVLLDIVLQDGSALPLAERLVASEVPFALTTGQDGVLLDHPLLRGAPCLRKPYRSTELQGCVRELYRFDLLKSLARIDWRITQTWDRIMSEARTISRHAAGGQDTRSMERRLRTIEELLVILERQRQAFLARLEPSN